jgi:hypothetical protein
LLAGTKNYITHLRGIEVIALGNGLEHSRAEVLWVLIGECALSLLSNPAWGPARINNPGFSHLSVSV